ncbi:endonuclease domain-containing protein [Fulvivirga ligni]|uniref:endonuclease domain-containing protein n=1 Tax=Fulvivirga ligni TaxID=2904246 RepID=UPI001F2DC162|nr:DUF559 domain-containing protein [Fulvivirga ligni]UII24020.1 DUF559 domain-containing protein [Fulvivirga ligni]
MKKEQLYNKPELKEFRKNLRTNGTAAEATLWKVLKNKQLEGRKFRRQYSVGNYILDFYCTSERLCIELDGADHFTVSGYEYDKERTAYLNSHNIRVIRFENKEVFDHLDALLEEIKRNFNRLSDPPFEKRGVG